MKATYKLNTKYNGNFTTIYVNFDNGTYAKVVTVTTQGLKYKSYKKISIDGNYDKTKLNVSVGSLGEVVVVPVSNETTTVGEVVNHTTFGKVEVVERNGQMLTVKLADSTIKVVMEQFFMNGVI